MDRASTDSGPISRPMGANMKGFNILFGIVIVICLALAASIIQELFSNILTLIFSLLGISTGLFGIVDIDSLSLWYLLLLFSTIIGFAFFQPKVYAINEANLLLALSPVFIYLLISLGGGIVDIEYLELLIDYYFIILCVIALFLYLPVFAKQPGEDQQAVVKSFMYIVLLFFLAGIVALLSSSTLIGVSANNQLDQTGDNIDESLSASYLFWKCDVLGGRLKNDAECIEQETTETVKARDEFDPLLFIHKLDATSPVVLQTRPNIAFIYDIDPPTGINLRLTHYTCETGRNTHKVNIEETEFAQFATNVPDEGVFGLRLECPVYEYYAEDKENTDPTVVQKLHFVIEDSITQFIPYIDCSNEFFTSQDNDILCEQIGREYLAGNINDPKVLQVLQRLSAPVTGAPSSKVKAVGLNGNLPLYLNNAQSLNPLRASYDYSLVFDRLQEFEISSVKITEVSPPEYISVFNSFEEGHVFDQKTSSGELHVLMELNVQDIPFEFIGGSDPLVVGYEIGHYLSSSTKALIQFPEEVDDTSSVGEILVEGGEESSDETSAEEDTTITS